jgi:hypothetical protein
MIMTSISKKSGKGLQEGVMSELATFWNVKPGHEDELRAAAGRFGEILHKSPPKEVQRTGLRDARLQSSITVGNSCLPRPLRPTGTHTSTMPF